MAHDALLGIDLGATAVKQEYALSSPRECWAEMDAEAYWRAVVAGVRDVRSRVADWRMASIGLRLPGQCVSDPANMESSSFYDDLGWWDEALKAIKGVSAELGSSREQVEGIFHDNAQRLMERVLDRRRKL